VGGGGRDNQRLINKRGGPSGSEERAQARRKNGRPPVKSEKRTSRLSRPKGRPSATPLKEQRCPAVRGRTEKRDRHPDSFRKRWKEEEGVKGKDAICAWGIRWLSSCGGREGFCVKGGRKAGSLLKLDKNGEARAFCQEPEVSSISEVAVRERLASGKKFQLPHARTSPGEHNGKKKDRLYLKSLRSRRIRGPRPLAATA